MLGDVATREPNEDRVGGDEPQGHHPPDVPNQRKARHRAEESGDESGRTVPWHLDRLIVRLGRQFLRLDRAPLDPPIRLLAPPVPPHPEVEPHPPPHPPPIPPPPPPTTPHPHPPLAPPS